MKNSQFLFLSGMLMLIAGNTTSDTILGRLSGLLWTVGALIFMATAWVSARKEHW